MLQIGVQSKNIVEDRDPMQGFRLLQELGFSCVDFSLNDYLQNSTIYQKKKNTFFDKSITELESFFLPHKMAAEKVGIRVNQMHMPYPIYLPEANKDLNEYLWNEVAPKSLAICDFLGSKNIVLHGFKMSRCVESEQEEWDMTERLIDRIALQAKELKITICIENLYNLKAGGLVEGPCCDIDKAIERIDRINKKYQAEVMGFCLDTGHANLVGLNFENTITKLDHRLKILHIHDNDGVADSHQIPFTFTKIRQNKSSTDWEGFIRGLRKIKYNQVLSFETAPVLSAFPTELKWDALELIYKIGKYFKEEIEL